MSAAEEANFAVDYGGAWSHQQAVLGVFPWTQQAGSELPQLEQEVVTTPVPTFHEEGELLFESPSDDLGRTLGLARIDGDQAGAHVDDEPIKFISSALEVQDKAGELVVGDKPTVGVVRRTFEWIRRNKAVTLAGAVTAASIVFNPFGPAIDAVGAKTALEVLGAEIALEVAWLAGAKLALDAAGLKFKFTLNPSKIREQFKELAKVDTAANIASNRASFNTGLVMNTVAAVGQVAIPTAVVTANLPISYWGVLAFGALDLWATYALRRPIVQHARTKAPSNSR